MSLEPWVLYRLPTGTLYGARVRTSYWVMPLWQWTDTMLNSNRATLIDTFPTRDAAEAEMRKLEIILDVLDS